MRILHVADLHLKHAWFGWVASHCSEFDLLVIAGDLQDAFSHTPMHDQARAVTTWLLSLSTPLVVCSGNHDDWVAPCGDPHGAGGWLRRLRRQGRVIGVDGTIIRFRGLRIAVHGWLQEESKPYGDIDILVTHAPPAGCPCASGSEGRDVGDPELWDAIKLFPPRLLLAGHVHEPGRLWCRWPASTEGTLVLVPGCNEHADVPAHWIIDTDAQLAVHNSGQTAELPGAQL